MRCNQHRISRAAKRKFDSNKIQQPGTFIQKAHESTSIKHKSRSSTKTRTDVSKELTILDHSKKRNKIATTRPLTSDLCCPFSLQLICMRNDNKWYIRSKDSHSNHHSGHLPIAVHHIETPLRNVNKEVMSYVEELLAAKIEAYKISICVYNRYNVKLSYDTIRQHHRYYLLHKINVASVKPYGTAVDQLLADFKNRPDVSYLYVTHTITSGFVTHYKGGSKINDDESNNAISVYQDEVATWRKQLSIADATQILVSFAWCHDEQLRLTRMYPEFLACDVTFGVTKEQRNLLVFVGVDSNNKTFPALHCFMPSKELRAYHWAFNTALPFLLSPQSLSCNQAISTDSEMAMYKPLRALMQEHSGFLSQSSHRLDKYHLFTKPWKENVYLKIGKCEIVKQKVKIIEQKLQKLFNYIETEEELKICVADYNSYYQSQKVSFRNEALCTAIEDIFLSLNANMKYFCHCYFIDVTTFDFLGDSIAEAFNSGLKTGQDKVSTNMTINTSAASQVQHLHTQNNKKDL